MVTDYDEDQLAKLMEQAEKENLEVSGDDDDDADEMDEENFTWVIFVKTNNRIWIFYEE